MKIAFIDSYPQSKGGAPKSMLTLIEGVRNEHDCIYICPQDGRLPELARKNRIEVLTTDASDQLLQGRKNLKSLIVFFIFLVKHWISSRKIINNQDFDVIYINDPRSFLLYLFVIFLNKNKTVYYTRINERIPVINSLLLIVIRKVILISSDSRYAYSSLFRTIFYKKFKVLHTGFEFSNREVTGLSNKELKICNVGTLCDRKNQMMILKSLLLLKDKGINFKVHFFGEYNQSDIYTCQMRNFILENKLESYVVFEGYSLNILNDISNFDIMISTSKLEGLPRSCIEAMSVGNYILSTQIHGIEDIIKDKSQGIILNENSAHCLAKNLESVINNIDYISSLGERINRADYIRTKFSLNNFLIGFTSILDEYR